MDNSVKSSKTTEKILVKQYNTIHKTSETKIKKKKLFKAKKKKKKFQKSILKKSIQLNIGIPVNQY